LPKIDSFDLVSVTGKNHRTCPEELAGGSEGTEDQVKSHIEHFIVRALIGLFEAAELLPTGEGLRHW